MILVEMLSDIEGSDEIDRLHEMGIKTEGNIDYTDLTFESCWINPNLIERMETANILEDGTTVQNIYMASGKALTIKMCQELMLFFSLPIPETL
jgi:hypothetical protein